MPVISGCPPLEVRRRTLEPSTPSDLTRVAALEIAVQYGVRPWLVALLDPETIQPTNDDAKKQIAMPPKYVVEPLKETAKPKRQPSLPPTQSASSRTRTLRSASPTKAPAPTPSTTTSTTTGRKIATPRRTRKQQRSTSNNLASTAEEDDEAPATEDGSPQPDEVVSPTIKKRTRTSKRSELASDDAPAVDTRKTSTASRKVTASVAPAADEDDVADASAPAVDSADDKFATVIRSPSEAQMHMDHARAALREATLLTASRTKTSRKRKVEDLFADDEDDLDAERYGGSTGADAAGEDDEQTPLVSDAVEPTSKRRKVEAEEEVKRDTMKKRAVVGMVASLAVG